MSALLPLPHFPDIQFRRYQGLQDVPGMLAVHAACQERDRLDPYSVCYRLPFLTPERYAQEITLPDATLIAEANGEIIAHSFMEAWGSEDRAYLWRTWVRPNRRGHGLGTLMHHWGENLARALHGTDTRPALHLANTTEHEADATTLLMNEGYHLSFISPELAFDITDDLPLPTPPPPITLRPLNTADMSAVARALCEANLDPRDETPQEHEDRIAEKIDYWNEQVADADPTLSVVAWDHDAIAGAYLCRRTGAVGDIAQVAVGVNWRGRGIARALARQSLHNLRNAGCVTARLFTSIGPDEVEPSHGPYAMYRKFGFYPIARHLRFRKPFTANARSPESRGQ